MVRLDKTKPAVNKKGALCTTKIEMSGFGLCGPSITNAIILLATTQKTATRKIPTIPKGLQYYWNYYVCPPG